MKALVTGRLSGKHPWYQVPSSVHTVDLTLCGVVDARNNGVSSLGVKEHLAFWLAVTSRSFPMSNDSRIREFSLRNNHVTQDTDLGNCCANHRTNNLQVRVRYFLPQIKCT